MRLGRRPTTDSDARDRRPQPVQGRLGRSLIDIRLCRQSGIDGARVPMSAISRAKQTIYRVRVDDQLWSASLREFTEAADMFAVLSRCLSVASQFDLWRRSHEEVAGADAANALDQARGDLERLVAGGGAALLQRVDSILDQLPTPWE